MVNLAPHNNKRLLQVHVAGSPMWWCWGERCVCLPYCGTLMECSVIDILLNPNSAQRKTGPLPTPGNWTRVMDQQPRVCEMHAVIQPIGPFFALADLYKDSQTEGEINRCRLSVGILKIRNAFMGKKCILKRRWVKLPVWVTSSTVSVCRESDDMLYIGILSGKTSVCRLYIRGSVRQLTLPVSLEIRREEFFHLRMAEFIVQAFTVLLIRERNAHGTFQMLRRPCTFFRLHFKMLINCIESHLKATLLSGENNWDAWIGQ